MECRWRNIRGRKLFLKAMGQETAPSQRELAAHLGVTEGLIYFWKVGARRPGSDLAQAIERLLGVPETSWLTPSELGRRKRLRAA